MKKGVGSGVGSGSISERYGSGDPDPHQNVTDPQHCFLHWDAEGQRGKNYDHKELKAEVGLRKKLRLECVRRR
jgi:hypothetical protein